MSLYDLPRKTTARESIITPHQKRNGATAAPRHPVPQGHRDTAHLTPVSLVFALLSHCRLPEHHTKKNHKYKGRSHILKALYSSVLLVTKCNFYWCLLSIPKGIESAEGKFAFIIGIKNCVWVLAFCSERLSLRLHKYTPTCSLMYAVVRKMSTCLLTALLSEAEQTD